MATRRDPSSTGILAAAFTREIRRRFDAWGLSVEKLIVDEAPSIHSDAHRLDTLKGHILSAAESTVLTTDIFGKSWVGTHVLAAYTRGVTRAYSDVQRFQANTSIDFMGGAKVQFTRGVLSLKSSQSMVEILTSHTLVQLKGVVDYILMQLSVSLSMGMIQGTVAVTNASRAGRARARALVKSIREIARRKAEVLAQDAMVRAQAEGQLDSFEAQGIESVSLYAEWTTAGDEKVCGLCKPLDGVQFTIKEARGLIPRHPRCRCAFAPGEVLAGHNRTRTLRRRLGESVLAERKQSKTKTKAERLRDARRNSTWAGAQL